MFDRLRTVITCNPLFFNQGEVIIIIPAGSYTYDRVGVNKFNNLSFASKYQFKRLN
ncbi:MAG: hypothetical protein JWP94_2472 [Mucilaginibacter sp.]|jgi:hypothetical protein|nr:hypothetical protein [Mucilaginibacter sp.]